MGERESRGLPYRIAILVKAPIVRGCGCTVDTFDEVKSTDQADRNL